MDDKNLDNFFASKLDGDAHFPNREINKQKVFALLDAQKKPHSAWLGKWIYWLALGLLLLGNGWMRWEMNNLKQDLAALKSASLPLSTPSNSAATPTFRAEKPMTDTLYRTTVVIKTDTIYRNIYVIDRMVSTATPIIATAEATFSNVETVRAMDSTSDFSSINSKKQNNSVGSNTTLKANQNLATNDSVALTTSNNTAETTNNQSIARATILKTVENSLSLNNTNATAIKTEDSSNIVSTMTPYRADTTATKTAEAVQKTDSNLVVVSHTKAPDTSALKLLDIEFEKATPKVGRIKKPLVKDFMLGVQIGGMNFLPFTPQLNPTVSVGFSASVAFNERWRWNVTADFSNFKFETAEIPDFLHLPKIPDAPSSDYIFRYAEGTQRSRLLTTSVQYILTPQKKVRPFLSATYSSRIIPTGTVKFEFKKRSASEELYISRTTDERIEQLLGGGAGIEADVSRRWLVHLRSDVLYDLKDASLLGILRGGLIYRF